MIFFVNNNSIITMLLAKKNKFLAIPKTTTISNNYNKTTRKHCK